MFHGAWYFFFLNELKGDFKFSASIHTSTMSMCELHVVSAMVIFPAAENGCILICSAENLPH